MLEPRYYSEDPFSTEKQEGTLHPEQVIQGAGGCFPEGTLVRTNHGYRRIETCKPSDLVLAYDVYGQIEFGYITEVHVHEKRSIDPNINSDIHYFRSEELELFPNGVTGNHAIYNAIIKEHTLASDLKIGDILEDIDGKQYPITDIIIDSFADKPDDYKVYNLTVYPQHTYLVGTQDLLIKVHNGGGSKGHTPVETKNNLQSSAIAKVLEVISHGEIVGVVGGAKGVFFNSTAIQNSDDSYNFEKVVFDSRVGLPSQTYIPGFSEVEAEVYSSPTLVTHATPVTFTLIDNNIDAARVTIDLPYGLWQNLDNGDITGYSVHYKINKRAVGSSTWILAVDKVLEGKCTDTWEIAHRISKPDGATRWEIQVVRVSDDDTVIKKRSTMRLSRVTEIQEETLTYDKIAYVGIKIPAESVGNQIPVRTYDVQGIKCKIPSNYNPITRTYSGYWNGAFQTAWTDNPAWILYDLITNPEYGISNYIGQTVQADIWAFYDAALYNDCATFVPNTNSYTYRYVADGKGGTEVRYTFNGVIQVQSDAWQLLYAVASNFAAIPVIANGIISIIQDRPKAYKKVITNSNVIEGLFNYTGTDGSTRATAVNVTYNDKYDRYLPNTITEEASSIFISKFGYSVKDIVAFGCTSEAQARRLAKYMLRTELYQHDLVNFNLSLNVVDISVGDVIAIIDNDYISNNNLTLGGRVVSASGYVITVDHPVDLIAGHTYKFSMANADYTGIFEATVSTGAGSVTTLTVNTAIPAGDYANHDFFCYSVGYIEPRQFVVNSITETETGIYQIMGVFYDPDKYDYVDYGTVVPSRSYSAAGGAVKTPGAFTITEHYIENNGITKHIVRLEWEQDTSAYYFRVAIRKDLDNFNYSNTNINSMEWEDPLPGIYDFVVVAYDIYGNFSLPGTFSYNYRITSSSSLLPPTNVYVVGTTTTTFNTPDLPIQWSYDTANDAVVDKLQDYIAEVWSADGLTVYNSYELPFDLTSKGGMVVYTNSTIKADFGSLPRSFIVKLYSRDLLGFLSNPVVTTFNNPAPSAPTGSISGDGLDVLITLDSASITLSDFSELILAFSTTTPFTPTRDTWYWRGPVGAGTAGVKLTAPSAGTYYLRAAITDNYDDNSLNWTSTWGITVTATGAALIFPVPDTPTGITSSVTHTTQATGETIHRLNISWTAPSTDVSGYTIAWLDYTAGESTFDHTITTTATSLSLDLTGNHTYQFKIRSDYGDAHSAYSTPSSVALGLDTTPTAAPTSLTVSNGYNTVTLKWANPADYDFSKTEVWYSATNDRATSGKVAETPANSYVFPDLAPGLTGYFWIRSVDTSGNLSAWHPTSATAGVVGTTAKIGTTDLQTSVNTSISNGETSYTDTINFRTAGAPTNSPTIGSVTTSASTVGTIDITLDWAYTQGTLPADEFILYVLEGTTNPSISSPVAAIINGASRTCTFYGIPVEKSYKVGITARRHTSSGVYETAIVNAWTRTGTTANITSNIGGTAAATVVSNASSGATAATDTATFRITGSPTNSPGVGTLTASAQSTSGTVDITVTWTYTQGTIAAEEIVIYAEQGTTVPTLSSPVAAICPVDITSYTFYGIPTASSYKVKLAARRKSAAGYEYSTISSGTLTRTGVAATVSAITVSGGNISGIGTGNNTAVANANTTWDQVRANASTATKPADGATVNTGAYATLAGALSLANKQSTTYFAADAQGKVAHTLNTTAFTTTRTVSVTINNVGTGQAVMIYMGCFLLTDSSTGGGMNNLTVALTRGATTLIATTNFLQGYPPTTQQILAGFAPFIDTPGAGNFTYTATYTYTKSVTGSTLAGQANWASISAEVIN